MATRRYEVIVDDLTGEEIPQGQHRTSVLEVDGRRVAIDLSPESAAAFDEDMKRWLASGTRVTAPVRNRRVDTGGSAPRNSPEFLAAVREFARKEGFAISDRGRIPEKVMLAYQEKHSR